jgi:hypothetical protein
MSDYQFEMKLLFLICRGFTDSPFLKKSASIGVGLQFAAELMAEINIKYCGGAQMHETFLQYFSDDLNLNKVM